MISQLKEIATFIQTDRQMMGCNFVGMGDDGEVFISFDHDDKDLEDIGVARLRENFPNTGKVTIVKSVSMNEVKKLVDDLNNYLEENTKPKKDNLLDIGHF